MMRPLVSIVIPTHNRAHLVTRAIDSALAQTYAPIEVIVVDDGSGDDTGAVLRCHESDARVRIVRHQRNLGATAAKNTGLDAVTGAFATILDSDDSLVPEAVATLMAAFDRQGPETGMVFANCVDVATGAWTGSGLHASGPVTFEDALRERFRGEFWGLWRASALGERRFDVRLAGGESLVWHDMYRTTRVWYEHVALRRYDRRSPDSVSRRQLEPTEAQRTSLIYERYIERFGEDLKRIAPHVLARNLQALAVWRILAGERRNGLRSLGASVRHAAGARQLALAAAIAVTPRSLLRRAMMKRRG